MYSGEPALRSCLTHEGDAIRNEGEFRIVWVQKSIPSIQVPLTNWTALKLNSMLGSGFLLSLGT